MRREVVVAAVAAAAISTAVLVRRWRSCRSQRRWKQAQRMLRRFARECATPVSQLWLVTNDLVSEMQSSLASDDQSILDVIVSNLTWLPTGDETGLYYGVNLHGDKILILRARLGGKNKPVSELHREEIPIPNDLTAATPKDLFDFIAINIGKFISPNSEDTGETSTRGTKLGMTISSLVDQVAVSTAAKWKSSAAGDTVGSELVNEMNQALEKHGVNLRAIALVDDTVGDLAGGRYYNKETVAAISLGMGTNASYIEAAHAVPRWQGPSPKSGEMVIDTQWGSFTSSHLPLTEFDASLDAESSNPSSRIFEKLVSGMYLGEIVSRVLLKMAQQTALFGDTVPPKLAIPYLLRSVDMAAMHQDTSDDHDLVHEKLKEIFEIRNSTPAVREVVAEICDIVAERGARLAGAGIVGIIKKLGRISNKKSVVTVEGGLYENYRIFRNYLHSSVWEMLGSDLSDNIVIEHAHGGPGAGAIFLAASPTQDTET